MNLIEEIHAKAKTNPKKILLVEGNEKRIQEAAKIISKEKIAEVILLQQDEKINLPGVEVIDMKKYPKEDLVQKLYLNRKHKGMTLEEAQRLIQNESYFGTMLLYTGVVDGLVSGAIHTTADTLKPALQIIKTKKDITTASSYFLMCAPKKTFFFADCAFVKNPTADELATIAISTADSVSEFGRESKVAMLSFSTKGSAEDPLIDKIRNATKIAQDRRPELKIEGELQLDAAIVPEVCKIKCPTSTLKGDANILIFPDLNSANIGYKLVERFSSTRAIGPIIQGLKKSVNDLSRGCKVQDIVDVVAITVIEAQKNEHTSN